MLVGYIGKEKQGNLNTLFGKRTERKGEEIN